VSPRFVPGGRFEAGEQILLIERKDYELAVRQRRSELIRAESDLKLEMGRQSVAKRECELLGREVKDEDKELLLRGPQLAAAREKVAAAAASLDKAELDLARTSVLSPFNALVVSRSVDLGSQVSPGTPLAALVGTDKYWVQVSVPLDELKRIDIPAFNGSKGAGARIYHEAAWGPRIRREGTVQRLRANLETKGRMARLLLSVKDPLKRPALLLDSYVRVEIQGRDLENAVRVPRAALREGNSVWIMKKDRTLDIRTVSIAWSDTGHVYVAEGLNEGDLLVTSHLGTPVAGMALRTAGDNRRKRDGRADE
jgi:RND family efflux transporter MFP subunit